MNLEGDIARALIALAGANAHGAVALHVDVHVAGGDIDPAFPVMDEGDAAGVAGVAGIRRCRDDVNLGTFYIHFNVTCIPVHTKNPVDIPFALNFDDDILDVKGEVAF